MKDEVKTFFSYANVTHHENMAYKLICCDICFGFLDGNSWREEMFAETILWYLLI